MANIYVVDSSSSLQDGDTVLIDGITYTVEQIDDGFLGARTDAAVSAGDNVLLANDLSGTVTLAPEGGTPENSVLNVALQPTSDGTSPNYTLQFTDPALNGSFNPTITTADGTNFSGVNINGTNTDDMTVNVGANSTIGNVTSGTEDTDNLTLTAGDGSTIGTITSGNNVLGVQSGGADSITLGSNVTTGNITLNGGDDTVSVGTGSTTGTISTGDGNDTILVDGISGNIDAGNGNDSITVNGTSGDVLGGDGSDTININGTVSGFVSSGTDALSGNDADLVNIGPGATVSEYINTGVGNDTINIGDGASVGDAGANSINTYLGDDVINIGSNTTLSSAIVAGDGSDSITMGDNNVLGGIALLNGGATGDTIVGGTGNTLNGDITQSIGDHTSSVTFGDSTTLNGSINLQGGTDSASFGAESSITGSITMGSDVSANDADFLEIGPASTVDGFINTNTGDDTVIIGDSVTLNGGWNAINTQIGDDQVIIGSFVDIANPIFTGAGSDQITISGDQTSAVNIDMGINIPNDDILTVDDPGSVDALQAAALQQGWAVTTELGQVDPTDGPNSDFNYGTISAINVDYLNVLCFARGTMIETDRGAVAIENLAEGDLVLTRDNGMQPIRWINSQIMSAERLSSDEKLRPIRIRRHALGTNIPSADLVVSPQHRVLVRSKIAQKMFGTDEILVAAKQLCQIDGIDIAHDLKEVEYFHFLFDQHEVVVSNGAETESLYTGPEALKSVGRAALEEIFAIFPELAERDYTPVAARKLATGRMGRKLAIRHKQNAKALVS